MGLLWIIVVLIVIIILVIVFSSFRIVSQSEAYVIEHLGEFKEVWYAGMHFKTPFVEKVKAQVSLKEQVVDFDPQAVITKDNVTMQIDTVVYFQIMDVKAYTYGVEDPLLAIENLTATSLRNIIGKLELDETLTSRERINAEMLGSLDRATDQWGIKVNSVELKNIIPPKAIRDAMEKQMKAERERREAILRAEGEKKSSILVAEGKKQSQILKAEADKQAAILNAEATKEAMIKKAEGEKQAMIQRAEGDKEATIRRSEGDAEAVRKVQAANADGLRYLREADADDSVLQLKSLEAFEKAADGRATKIIIPSEIQGIAGLAKSVAEVVKDDTNLVTEANQNAGQNAGQNSDPKSGQ